MSNPATETPSSSVLALRRGAGEAGEQKRVAEVLRESERRQHEVLDLMPAGVYLCDATGQITYFNRRATEIWGVPATASLHQVLTAQVGLKVYEPDGRLVQHPELARLDVLTSGRPARNRQVILERPDGARLSILANIDPIRDDAGKVVGAINVFQDVTERSSAEQTVRSLLKLSERLHATLDLESLLDALALESMTLLGASGGCAGWHTANGMVADKYFSDRQSVHLEYCWRPGHGLPGWLLEHKVPYVTNDAAHDPQIIPELRERFHIRNAVSVPIIGLGREVLGFFQLHNKPGGFAAADVELLNAIARIAAIALQNALAHRKVVRAEAALRDSEQRFGRFMEHLPGLAWIKDAEGRYIYVNDAAEKAFGKQRTELHGKKDDDLFPPDTAAVFKSNDREALASPAGISVTETLKHPDGALHESLISKFAIPGAEGEPGLVGGMAIDITDRKRAEEALQRSEQRFRFLAEMMPSMSWTADPHGKITYANKRWVEYCGVDASQNVHEWPEMEQHPDDRARCLLEWTMALHDGREYEVEVRNRRYDGVYRWFITRAVPMKDAEGRVLSWFGVTTDIHDLKAAQQQLHESDRRKDEFLATLSHELRNPLAPLSLAAQMLSSNPGLDARTAEMISVMQRQVDHMVRLIDDLMEISRISRGKIELRRTNVELNSVLDNSVELARPHIEAALHRLEVSLPEKPVTLYADPVRLAQIVANLLNNAAKYTPEGGCISLSANRAGGEVVVRVRDNGAGISPEALPHIFDLFAQGDRAPLNTQGGLGIGLSLAKGLAELHGGTITAHSDGLGFGSEFTVRIPIKSAPPITNRLPRSGRFAADSAKGLRVLVVDDNKAAATMLGLALETLGASVRAAYDGETAVHAAAEFQPSIVFMDIGMPGLDGHEAARLIRAARNGPEMLLVAVSGWGQPDIRARSKAAGFDEHLVKPVELAQLRQILGQVTGQGSEASAGSSSTGEA
jgi:PAS domain S-box-containing protein